MPEESNVDADKKEQAKQRIKKPDYLGLPEDMDKLVVQLSHPLVSLTESDLSLAELKIFLVYLARIDSHAPDKTYVSFTKSELENILGVKRILESQLDKRLTNLLSGVVRVEDPTETPKGYSLFPLFSEAKIRKDKHGISQVDLICSEKAAKYIFNIEHLRYLQPKAVMLLSLDSRYSLTLYLQLAKTRRSHGVTTMKVGLDELRIMLNCTNESYSQFKEFNRYVLKRSMEEIEQKTDLRFLYDPIYEGHSPTSIEFYILPPKDDLEKAQKKIAESDKDQDEDPITHDRELTISLLQSACNEEFSRAEILYFMSLFSEYHLYHTDFESLAQYHFLEQLYAKMNTLSSIGNRFTYLSQMIKQELGVGKV